MRCRRRHLRWHPGERLWPALALLAVAIAATAVSAASSSMPGATTVVATVPGVTVRTGAVPAPPAPTPTVTTGPLPQAPGTAPATAPPAAPGLAPWPPVATAYTDVLASVPLAAGRAPAVAAARRARAAGLPRAGVLLSATYPSLRAGYWVAFSGVYRTPSAALAALAAVHARGFAGAYVARVTRP